MRSATENRVHPTQASPAPGASEYRYERKFAVSELDRAEVESILRFNPAGFSEIYHRRWVNNFYFDTFDGESHWDNVSGSSRERLKVRIRWYGNFEGTIEHPVLELKIRRGMVNRKLHYPLETFRVDRGLGIDTVRGLIRNSEMNAALMQNLLNLRLSLANRYRRAYFLSANGKFRVTVDSELRFHGLSALGRVGFLGRWIRGSDRILELKYDERDDRQADPIAQHLPFRLSRSSKYVSGRELTQAHLGFL